MAAQSAADRLRDRPLSRTALIGIAALLGGLYTLAFAPFQAVPFVFVAFSGLLWLLLQAPSIRSAALLGWAFGLGHFASSLYWIAHSFYVDADRFGALAIPAVLGLSAFLSLFPAFACAGAYRLGGSRGPALWLSFAGLWSSTEWLRGHIFTGFPWNLAGYVWTAFDEPLQAASVVGIYGLGLITIAAASLPALAFRGGLTGTSRWAVVSAACLAVGMLWLSGEVRLSRARTEPVEGVRLRLVQPNVPQRLKWRPDQREAILDRLAELSSKPARDRPTHVLWPETASPVMMLEDGDARRQAIRALPSGAILVTGTVRREVGAGGLTRFFNSVGVITSRGEVADVYDKVRLVPFGEYVPLRALIPFDKLTSGSTEFSVGARAAVLTAPGVVNFQPLICYEAIFPGHRPDGERPEWLLNLTNDAWFGDSPGPYQHFAMARVRAVERGLPLVRVANTGISAVVDAYGRVLARLPLNADGVLDAPLPAKLRNETFFVRYGNGPFLGMVGLTLLLAALTGWGNLYCKLKKMGAGREGVAGNERLWP